VFWSSTRIRTQVAKVGAVALSMAALLVIGGLPSAAETASPTGKTVTPAQVKLWFTERASGFGSAVLVTNANDNHSGRMYVVDKAGLIYYWTSAGGRHVFLDLRSEVKASGDEQGLLGLVFDPLFYKRAYFWVSYTTANGSLQVSRFTAPTARATSVSRSTEVKVLNIPHPTYTNHNAGMLVFDRTGYMFIGTGDGGGAGDPFNHAQSLTSLSGKILRINVEAFCPRLHYCIPPTNPFVKSKTARHEIWLYGLRNPWRFSVDPGTGELWIGDVGQARYEEVDAVAYRRGGYDMGWSCKEGVAYYNRARCLSGVSYLAPVAVIAHPTASALIGGVVYRGKTYASLLAGKYIFGDYVTGHVWTLSLGHGYALNGHLAGVDSFDSDGSGTVWATTLSGGLYTLSAYAA
jgi:glucose/arabinose dehydrogenase